MCPPAHESARSESRDPSKFLIEKILNGAEGQNRTADTVIFSHVLYQLSYLGTAGMQQSVGTPRSYQVKPERRACWQPPVGQ